MRVGFDASALGAQTTGAGEYQRQLLATLPDADPEVELVVYTAQGARLAVGGSATQHEMPWATGNRTRRILQGGWAWRRRWRTDRLDLLHVPFYYLPPGAPRRSVVTIYDARFLRYPETYQRARHAFLRTAVPWSLRRAGHIITISAFTKRELVDLLGLPPEKISVTLLAPRAEFARVEDGALLAQVRARYGLPERFVLSTSTLEPRKNLARAVEAFAELRRRGVPHSLVLAGVRHFGIGDLEQAITRHGMTDSVRVLGYVEDADMASLYSLADAFIYPSLYEGFGIPPLEAMACGTPVVASNVTSIPEVVGEAACLVNPRDVGSIADGLASVLTDPLRAAELRLAGAERVRTFSWKRTAQETAAVYQRVLRGLG
jgi:glycosyltransferase involved in cell wall biosynthesis